MKTLRFPLCLLVLALAVPVWAEVIPKSLSVSQTVTSYSFPPGTTVVLLISDGEDDCFYRLFHNAEASADATASATGNLVIKSGEAKTYNIQRQSTAVVGSRGTAWRTISAICGSGETATFRIESF